MSKITLDINDYTYEVEVEKNEILLNTLREKLDLTGAKQGCQSGSCGACKVLIDKEAVKACKTLSINCEGKKIYTIEGFAKDGKLHPIQESFIEAGAVQCGYCTPGMVITAQALLYKNEQPTDEEIKEAFKENLCRCTGYIKIVDAVKLAAKKLEVK